MARHQLTQIAMALVFAGLTTPFAFAQSDQDATAASADSQRFSQPEFSDLGGGRPAWLVPMHVATATIQALDAHSTYKTFHHRGVETNLLLKGVTSNQATFFAIKAGVAAAVIYSTEKLARRNRPAAFALGLAVNSAFAMLAAHNYSEAARLSPRRSSP